MFCYMTIFLTNTDIALIKNNAKAGAQIAVEYATLTSPTNRYSSGFTGQYSRLCMLLFCTVETF